MSTMIFLAVGSALVVVIALLSVGRVVGRLSGESQPAVYELHAAVEWIADRLPEEVTARISYEDVAQILSWHLDWFSSTGVSSRHGQELGGAAAVDDGSVAVDEVAVDAVVARSLAEGGPESVDVVCVLKYQMLYLKAIGALEPEPDHGKGLTQPGEV